MPSYIGLAPKDLLTSNEIFKENNTNGGLTIVGSYVKKSSEQLTNALSLFDTEQIVEVDVSKVLSEYSGKYLKELITAIDDIISKGNDVIVYTSRELITGKDTEDTVDIASRISKALVGIVRGIKVSPKYLIAKGGITSHDLATKGLGMQRSKVLGQVQPGIPFWEMGMETKFSKLSIFKILDRIRPTIFLCSSSTRFCSYILLVFHESK